MMCCIYSCDWQFKLPEYMVHQEYKGNVGKASRQQPNKRGPIGWDKKTAYERENSKPNDKTVKIPEEKRSGHGVRGAKMDARQAKKDNKHDSVKCDQQESTQNKHQRSVLISKLCLF